MKPPQEAELLRIFIGENDKIGKKPLYKVIVELARKNGLAGATVLRGILGFGAASRIHTAGILRLSEDLPLLIEIVDTNERIDGFLKELDSIIDEGLITREKVQVLFYKHKEQIKIHRETPHDAASPEQ